MHSAECLKSNFVPTLLQPRGYYGTELWYGMEIQCYIFLTVHFLYFSNACFALLLQSAALFLFCTFSSSLYITLQHQVRSPPITPHNFKQQYCEQVELLRHNYNTNII